jgi:hypothetical protein
MQKNTFANIVVIIIITVWDILVNLDNIFVMSLAIRSYIFPQEIKRNEWRILISHTDGHIGGSNGNTSLVADVSPDWASILDRLRIAGSLRCPYTDYFKMKANMGVILTPDSNDFINPSQAELIIISCFSEMPTYKFYGSSSSSIWERFWGGNETTAKEAVQQILMRVNQLPYATKLLRTKIESKGGTVRL